MGLFKQLSGRKTPPAKLHEEQTAEEKLSLSTGAVHVYIDGGPVLQTQHVRSMESPFIGQKLYCASNL